MKKTVLWTIFISALGFAQQLVVKTNEGMTSHPAITTAITASFINNTVTAASSEETVRLIVELRSPSRIEQRMNKRTFSKSSSIQAKQEILTVVDGSVIEKEFENVFSGFVLTTKRENLEKIASLPGVKNVYPDVIVLSTPVSVNATTLFVPQSTQSVASGNGIRIGVIDTGIDYNHEAFGGGFGDNFIITGGYDFVNNDPDPMDDNGHGTHVAGIIGGHSSTINGLAYNAKIFAYKALDKNGSGSASTVIAAIERAIDDGVQVLNLSLGSPGGNAADPLTQSVNRAVQAGIVVVVAAGNTGGFGTINSPGIAKNALTVGASDAKAIASFSAKGPVTEEYQIKPDVIAQGVGVLSAKSGGGYVQMSGTSMATPFVTAIAAGLKELHPDWSALQIKDAIISNSTDLRLSVFSQGHGKIDEQILDSDIFASPAQISFGFNPPAQSIWTQKETVRIFNKTGSKKSYQLISATTNPALQFRFIPLSVEIGSMQDSEIEIELAANNVILANNNEFENGYTGKILAVCETDTLVIPYAFFKGTVMQIRFNEIPWQIMVHDQKDFSKMVSPKANYLSLIVNEGTYDIAALFFGSRYVIKENIAVSGHSDVAISSGDATLPVSFQPIDERGENLNMGSLNGTYSNLEVLVHRTTGFAIISMGGGKANSYFNRNKYFSVLSDKYAFGFSLNIQPSNLSSYTFDYSIDSGITASRSITYSREELKHLDVQFRIDTTVQRIFPITWTSYIGKANSVSVTFYDGTSQPLTYPFIQRTIYTQRSGVFPIFHQREAFRY